ncbi:MAG: cyclic nucleotide-binding domain-containing protein [Elusimicrobiales bacterium]|nr:cyclic nucleotide-binding domain-containing protein [Elusimicrobiales bacterium]
MNESDFKSLKEISMFKKFGDDKLKEFFKAFDRKKYAAGDIVFKEGDEGNTLFILIEGEVVIEKKLDEEGKEFKQLALLSAGEFFGEMAVIEEKARTAQARAYADTVLYELSHQDFFNFIKEQPETGIPFLVEITKTVLRRLQNTSNELTMLFDLSNLVMEDHESSKEFLIKAAGEIAPYLDGIWNIDAHMYNQFNEEYDLVLSQEKFKEEKKISLSGKEIKTGWFNERAYVAVFNLKDKKLGYILFSKETDLSNVERNNLSTIFNTISSILASAMENIDHRAELLLMEKLKEKKYTI